MPTKDKVFQAPIPGQSLTATPKNYPWERPPEIVEPDKAIKFHIERLADEERMDNLLNTLEFGFADIKTVTKTLLRSAVSQGIHTVDVSLLIAPVIHEYIKQTADVVGIEYKDGITDKDEKSKTIDYKVSELAKKKLKKMGMVPEETVMDEQEEESKPKGLMAKER